jgi:hypothetical protein
MWPQRFAQKCILVAMCSLPFWFAHMGVIPENVWRKAKCNQTALFKLDCLSNMKVLIFLSFFFLSNFMRQECLDSRFVFDRPLPVSRLVSLIGSSILFMLAFMIVNFKGF